MIEISNTSKNFDSFKVLDNINLTIPKGVAFGLLGSNGAGKSTILRLLCGIYKADSGSVTIDGQPIFNNPSIKEKVFFINDETIQFANFTLKELKNFYKGFYPNFSEELFEKLRQTINLPLNKKTNAFSKGMKRQAIVIIALACQTEYLLLKEINEVFDSVALLHQGKIVFSRDLDSVKSNIHKVQVVFPQINQSLPQSYTQKDFPDLDILHFEQNHSVYHIIIRGGEDEIKEKFKAKNPLVLDIIPISLEEIFIYEMEVLGYDFNGIDK